MKNALSTIWSQAHRHLEDALPEIDALMDQKFSKAGGSPEPGSVLDQMGLRDGAETVRQYMAINEWGLALGHLCYMIVETNLPITLNTYASLEAACHVMQMDMRLLQRIKSPPL